MSPGIGVTVRVPARSPRLALASAVAQARAQSIPLSFDRLGVVRATLTGAWVIDRTVVPGLNVVGCLLLQHQPASTADEDPTAAAARAIGVSLAFMEGASDGFAMEAMNAFWVGSPHNGRDYLNGFEAGAEIRFLASKVCGNCGSRRFKSELRCPGCDR